MKKLICLLAAAMVLSGCAGTSTPKQRITSYEQLKGANIATVVTDAVAYEVLEQNTKLAAKPMYFNATEDMIQAVISGKADAAVVDEMSAKVYQQTGDKLTALPPFGEITWSFITQKDNTKLLNEMNPIINRLCEDGTIDRLEEKWTQADLAGVALEQVTSTGENGTLKVAVGGNLPGYCFIKDNELVGCDIDLIQIIAAELGYAIEFVTVGEDAFVPMVTSGKVDICAIDMPVTEESKDQVAFFDAIYLDGLTVLVKK